MTTTSLASGWNLMKYIFSVCAERGAVSYKHEWMKKSYFHFLFFFKKEKQLKEKPNCFFVFFSKHTVQNIFLKGTFCFQLTWAEGSQGELIGWDSSRRPCVRASVRPCVHPHFQTWISPRPAGRLQSNLSEASLGWGKGCIMFWCRSDQNSGFHGNG